MLRRGMTWMMLVVGLMLAGGCASADRHVVQSTAMRPATVSLVDTLEGDVLWEMDVPPNHQLVVRLKRSGEPAALRVTGQPATGLSWAIYESPRSPANDRLWRSHVEDGELELEGRPVRLEVDYLATARHDPPTEQAPPREPDVDVEADEPSEPAEPADAHDTDEADEADDTDDTDEAADELAAGDAADDTSVE